MFGLEAADGALEGSDESRFAWILRGCMLMGLAGVCHLHHCQDFDEI
jgi:hypothetical protein